MSKRTRFVIISLILALSLWLSTVMSVEWRFGLVLSVCAMTYILSVLVLFDDLKGIEWFTLMVLPTMFALGAGLFANFLPTSIPRFFGKTFQVETAMLLSGLLRILYFLLVSVGLYGILLIENIFSVASIRTIQLFRAARSVNFILTLLTALFFYTTIFGLKLPFYWIGIMSFVVTVMMAFPSLWSVDLKINEYKILWKMSSLIGLVLVFMSIALSFWPLKPFMAGLMLTSMLYAQLGIFEQKLSSRFYFEGIVEYIATVSIICLVGFLTTSWVGT
jgi:hypothetical protein